MNLYDSFVMTFYALDSMWDGDCTSVLASYLKEANSSLFDETGTADMSMCERFIECYNEYGTQDNMYYDFIAQYLESEYGQEVSGVFAQMTVSDWVDAFEDYIEHKKVSA